MPAGRSRRLQVPRDDAVAPAAGDRLHFVDPIGGEGDEHAGLALQGDAESTALAIAAMAVEYQRSAAIRLVIDAVLIVEKDRHRDLALPDPFRRHRVSVAVAMRQEEVAGLVDVELRLLPTRRLDAKVFLQDGLDVAQLGLDQRGRPRRYAGDPRAAGVLVDEALRAACRANHRRHPGARRHLVANLPARLGA